MKTGVGVFQNTGEPAGRCCLPGLGSSLLAVPPDKSQAWVFPSPAAGMLPVPFCPPAALVSAPKQAEDWNLKVTGDCAVPRGVGVAEQCLQGADGSGWQITNPNRRQALLS